MTSQDELARQQRLAQEMASRQHEQVEQEKRQVAVWLHHQQPQVGQEVPLRQLESGLVAMVPGASISVDTANRRYLTVSPSPDDPDRGIVQSIHNVERDAQAEQIRTQALGDPDESPAPSPKRHHVIESEGQCPRSFVYHLKHSATECRFPRDYELVATVPTDDAAAARHWTTDSPHRDWRHHDEVTCHKPNPRETQPGDIIIVPSKGEVMICEPKHLGCASVHPFPSVTKVFYPKEDRFGASLNPDNYELVALFDERDENVVFEQTYSKDLEDNEDALILRDELRGMKPGDRVVLAGIEQEELLREQDGFSTASLSAYNHQAEQDRNKPKL